jgi:hypothetical protein
MRLLEYGRKGMAPNKPPFTGGGRGKAVGEGSEVAGGTAYFGRWCKIRKLGEISNFDGIEFHLCS